ncbi:suppressor of glycerol defect protein, putative [Candida dubliniensis CD36]|uniref:Suppressor of glycerol defect protein, putative n=1 Tax=Candida dubliniensis (strain CD36 / ATCC MYA-646 / CBS 7987 / NCPF 3949 / NRRL Y-17841) TaxID=573826 RepID=B9WLG5_CANDC|nr:suppressor of glycerol defect protein, putative [Candida dubliniensis CD36]CAX39927.1 suppressor of glycerol defect protein, putative [Candida dubliniensis CD36]
MARFNNEEILNSVGLPSQLLQQIKNKENKGDYDDDDSEDRFTKFEKIRGTKRKSKPISRKDKRKQERELKKQKRVKKDTHPQKIQPKKQNENKQDPLALLATKKNKSKSRKIEEDNPLEALRKLKETKNNNNKTPKAKSDIKIVKEDELLDDEVSDLGYSEDDFSSENETDFEDVENINMDPMEALRALKQKKNGSNKASSDIRIVKEDDLDDDDISDFEEAEDELQEDNDPMEALRLLKSKKNKSAKTSEIRIVKEDELEQENDDEVSDLVSDENFDDQEEEEDFGGFEDASEGESDFGFSEDDEEEEDPLAKLKAIKEAKRNGKSEKTKQKQEKEVYPIDPHLQEQFRKDDEDIEYYAKKLGLKNGKKSKLSKTDDDDIIGGLLDGLDLDFESAMENIDDTTDDHISEEDEEYSSDYLDNSKKVKENPYVAPGSEETKSSEESEITPQRYIPPALRKKMALEAGEGVSEETLKLRKSIKGPLNKLSEANISSIVSEINALYLSHPRQVLNEEITNIILSSIVQQGRLLDTFVYLHATVVVALYRLQGVEFGAHFIQTIVEKFETYQTDSSKTKEASNIISLLSSVYLFQLVSSKLLYDLIKELINNLDENNADLLLRLIRNSGNQMRSDDPSALKEIVLLINGKVSTLPKDSINTRTQFLIETISSLKNNKLKIVNEANHQLSVKLKKFLGGINENKSGDPIQVSLQDIQNVVTRGKWWLVGSAWKGHETDKPKDDVDIVAMSDILDNAEPNWMELAKAQRMNTDIRRAIFVSIMSANDYIDAVTKLDKLALKRNQEREIPKVLIHCATMEPSWNPYYGVLGNKLCDSHSFRKTFQFMLWDLIKELDGGSADDEEEEDNFIGFDSFDEENKMKRILNLGRFYAFLLAEGSMPLHNLRTVNFLTASSDTVLFLEVLLVSFFDQVGKKSRKNSVGGGLQSKAQGMYEQKYDDRLLVERVLKAKDQTTMLRGLQYFVQQKVKTSEVVSGKKQLKRVEWGVDALFDIIDEFLKNSED